MLGEWVCVTEALGMRQSSLVQFTMTTCAAMVLGACLPASAPAHSHATASPAVSDTGPVPGPLLQNAAASLGWFHYVDPAGAFTAWFPVEPTADTRDGITLVMAFVDGATYMVGRLPDPPLMDVNQQLRQGLSQGLSDIGFTKTEERFYQHGNLHFVIANISGIDDDGQFLAGKAEVAIDVVRHRSFSAIVAFPQVSNDRLSSVFLNGLDLAPE